MIHFFNPGHETAVHNISPYYTAPTSIIAMQRDLVFLPAWYVCSTDVVFVWDNKDSTFYKFLKDNLDNIPEAITKRRLKRYGTSAVRFWGVSPQIIHFWNNLNKEYRLDLNIPIWSDEYIRLNSRESARDCLIDLMKETPQIGSEVIPEFCHSLESVEQLVLSSSSQLLAKAPYSSSGRGLLWLPVEGLTRTENQIINGILNKQRIVSIERVLDKQLDFAMEFMADGQGKARFVGYSLFETNKKGAYQGNFLATQECIENRIKEMVSASLLDDVKCHLERILSDKYAAVYSGCIGVDMMAYIQDDNLQLHPCVEINMRYNMGYLALMFSRTHLHDQSEGYFYLDFSAKEYEILNRHKEMKKQYPAIFENRKLKSGYLSLCPVSKNSHYRAYVLID